MSQLPVELTATIERKQPSLPRFVVVPARLLESWALNGATVVEATLNGIGIGRRTLKRWDDRRWFVELPQPVCERCGVDVGAAVVLRLAVAAEELPAELLHLLDADPAARAAWAALTASGQRMLREHVLAANGAATRLRRAAKALRGGI